MSDVVTHPGWAAQLAVHAAVRRDTARLVHVLGRAASEIDARAIVTFWSRLAEQLHHHHQTEDSDVWPLVRSVLGRDVDAVLDGVNAEHALMVSAMSAVDVTMSDLDNASSERGAAADAVVHFQEVVTDHLDHEEQTALPLLPLVLDRQAMADFFARHEGEMSPELFLPWILDGAPTPVVERFVVPLPEHIRSMLIEEWQPARRRLVEAIGVDRP